METNSAWFSTNRWRHCFPKSSRTELSAVQSHSLSAGDLAVNSSVANSSTAKGSPAISGIHVALIDRIRGGQYSRFNETIRLFVSDYSPEIEELFIQLAS